MHLLGRTAVCAGGHLGTKATSCERRQHHALRLCASGSGAGRLQWRSEDFLVAAWRRRHEHHPAQPRSLGDPRPVDQRLLKLPRRLVLLRSRYLKMLDPNIHDKQRVLESLVSMWRCAAIHGGDSAIRAEVEAILKRFSVPISQRFLGFFFVLCMVGSGILSGSHNGELCALRGDFSARPAWFQTGPRCWLVNWTSVVPRALQAVNELGWRVTNHGWTHAATIVAKSMTTILAVTLLTCSRTRSLQRV